MLDKKEESQAMALVHEIRDLTEEVGNDKGDGKRLVEAMSALLMIVLRSPDVISDNDCEFTLCIASRRRFSVISSLPPPGTVLALSHGIIEAVGTTNPGMIDARELIRPPGSENEH